jgi:hypothetical protein
MMEMTREDASTSQHQILLPQTLKGLIQAFQPNELAYLAMTTKIELPFRDRLAFQLHQILSPTGLLVTREWNRIDLAVLDKSSRPLCLIELKAMYTFDAGLRVSKFTSATSADEQKAIALALPITDVYSLLLATHTSSEVDVPFRKAVKYSSGINSAIRLNGGSEAVHSIAVREVNSSLANRAVVAHGSIDGGQVFGIGVTVLYWLVQNRAHQAQC